MDRQPKASHAKGPRGFAWLDVSARPLDMNGPTKRVFRRFRDEDRDQPIIAHLERMARQRPHHVALSDSQTTLTYGQLWDAVTGLAQTITAQTEPGQLVGIVLAASVRVPLAMLACLAAGCSFTAIDPGYPEDWVRQVLADACPALIIVGDCAVAGTDFGSARVMPLTVLPQAAQQGWQPALLDVDQPACVIYTSGSTGRPKGVVNAQRGLLQRVAQSINAAHINTNDRLLTLASPGTIVGVRDIMTALLAGGRIHIVDPGKHGAREILDIIRAEAITILFAFPALLRSLVSSATARADPALRLVRVGGDTTLWGDIDLLRAWLKPGAAIQLIYAATEAPMMQWFIDDACRSDDPRLPIGYPLTGNRLALVDEDGQPAPAGEIGQLVVAGPNVALGLWVSGRCVPQERLDGSPSRLFRTGDIVRQRPDGLIERLGRTDRQVKIRGARVELDAVEAALRQHLFVDDVGALTRTGSDAELSLVAYVSPRAGAPADLQGQLRALMQRFPAPMRPAHLYLTSTIPRLPNSKPDRQALIALDETHSANRAAHYADASGAAGRWRDHIEQTVARIWREALQTARPNPDDDFFDSGGDSLMAITVVAALEEALHMELSISLITEAPTFGALCAALRTGHTGAYSPLVALKSGVGVPVFFIHGVGGTVADLLTIARYMAWSGPVIGIQACGLKAGETPHTRVETMADAYLLAIRSRQPEGPYYLCGYSFGGLVAYEIARRLTRAGEKIGLVGLFDTMTSPLIWPVKNWRGWARQLSGQLRWGPKAVAPSPGSMTGLPIFTPARSLAVRGGGLIASARYRPGYYSGELTLFTPTDRDPALPSPRSLWRGHARCLNVIQTCGGHLTMLAKPHARSTAESLTRCLPDAVRLSQPVE